MEHTTRKIGPPDRPDWIKVRGLNIDVQRAMAGKLHGSNTVCLSAKCPNIGECFGRGIAAFMIAGTICTRACGFCGVKHGVPEPLDPDEPIRIAGSVHDLGLKYVVITAVTRDDLDDGAAGHFSATVKAIRELNPDTGIEILIPDFGGKREPLQTVLDSRPAILNHNIETVRRLTPVVRSRASYDRSLKLLEMSKRLCPGIPTKSGIMLGLGEEWDEVTTTFQDLLDVGCELVTIGQYLQPRSGQELPVVRYWTPEEFEKLDKTACEMGFSGVASGPFVRSSYFADELAQNLQ